MVKSLCKAGHTTAVTAAALDWYCPHHCHSTLDPPALTMVSAYLLSIQVESGVFRLWS